MTSGSTRDTPVLALHVSTIDIRLTSGSKKTIRSIKLAKNWNQLPDIPEARWEDDVHRIVFIPPLDFGPDDCISLSVNCSWLSVLRKQVVKDITIDIVLNDTERMRRRQGIRYYRKRKRNVEVEVSGYETVPVPARLPTPPSIEIENAGHESELHPTTTSFIEACPQFRVLVIGNSGVGKSSLIRKVFGVEDVHVSDNTAGAADINQEFVSPTNHRFIVHDSLGFEAGDEQNLIMVKEFVSRRKSMPLLKDQLHAIWLCLEIPWCGGALLEEGTEEFLHRRREILGDVPLVVVLTMVDLLDRHLWTDLPANTTLEDFRSWWLNKYCTDPLYEVAGRDVAHIAVSVRDGYSEALANLMTTTRENMTRYHVNEAPRVVMSIAQRVSIKEKIEQSISIGKKKYWKMLLKSAVFRGHTLRQCLQVIHKDVITIWNFIDPDDKCLMDETVIGDLLRSDNLGPLPDASADMVSLATSLLSFLGMLGSSLESGDITIPAAVAIAKFAFTVLQMTYTIYTEATKDVKFLIAYIVDLICVMQVVYLLTAGGHDPVNPEIVSCALRAHDQSKRAVHALVERFDGKQGMLPKGRDHVLEKIDEWIWRFSITAHEIEELRQHIGEVLPSSSS